MKGEKDITQESYSYYIGSYALIPLIVRVLLKNPNNEKIKVNAYMLFLELLKEEKSNVLNVRESFLEYQIIYRDLVQVKDQELQKLAL